MARHTPVIGESFVPGEVWLSPKGTYYRVVSREGFKVVLRSGLEGKGRKITRGWSDVINWVRPPEHNSPE